MLANFIKMLQRVNIWMYQIHLILKLKNQMTTLQVLLNVEVESSCHFLKKMQKLLITNL